MHRPGISHEVGSRPGVPGEELVRQHVTLQPVARGAGSHEVSGNVGPAARDGVDVVQRGDG
jgi:hypothetical protein